MSEGSFEGANSVLFVSDALKRRSRRTSTSCCRESSILSNYLISDRTSSYLCRGPETNSSIYSPASLVKDWCKHVSKNFHGEGDLPSCRQNILGPLWHVVVGVGSSAVNATTKNSEYSDINASHYNEFTGRSIRGR